MKKFCKQKTWWALLFAALMVYTLKSIFVGADIDEAYGVTLGYRLVQGDRLLRDLWEPHQTSAIFTALFIRCVLLVTGGSLNGLTVLLRVLFFILHTAISVYLYKSFRECLPSLKAEEAGLLAVIYYLTTPKCIYVPEYSNLHMWFSTLMALFLMRFYCVGSTKRNHLSYMVLAGIMMACDVLAYPSMLLLYPLCLLFVCVVSGRRAALAFSAPCLVGAVSFVGYLCTYLSPAEMMDNVRFVLTDGSHKQTLWDKIALCGSGFGQMLLMIVGCGIFASLIQLVLRRIVHWGRVHFHCEKTEDKSSSGLAGWIFWWVAVQTILQVYLWFHSEYNSGYPQLTYVFIPCLGLLCYRKSLQKSKTGLYLILLAAVNYFCLILFSNWSPIVLGVYLVTGLLGGLICIRQYQLETLGGRGRALWSAVCILWIAMELFGRSILTIGGDDGSKMLYQVRGICKDAVRGGIITSYMNAYRYNDNYLHFSEIVEPGSNVFYVGPSQYYYMLGDCRIAAPSTISTPEYDESVKLYFERHPERFPDVVVMESCYGDVSFLSEEDYIYTWIKEEFQPDTIEEYPYVRVYKKGGIQ